MTLTSGTHTYSCTQSTIWTIFQFIDFNSSYKTQYLRIFPYKSTREQSWPCCKVVQGQPRIITWTNFEGSKSLMLYTKFEGHRPAGFGEDFFKGFKHTWAWRPFWSNNLDHLNKLLFPTSQWDSTWNLALIGPVVSEEMFEECRRWTDDDERKTEPAYTTSSPMCLKAQVSL